MSKKQVVTFYTFGKCRGRTCYEFDAAKEAATLLNKEAFLCRLCKHWHVAPLTDPARLTTDKLSPRGWA